MVRLRRGYRNRQEAGEVLAKHVAEHLGPDPGPVTVLGLARGGVPVGAPIADRLGADLDVLTVRKIGTPGHRELAIGAVASGGLMVVNDDLIARLGLRRSDVEAQAELARRELAERESRFRREASARPLDGQTVIVVDDGLATGATMRAAIDAVRAADPAAVIAAVPVGAPDSCELVAESADALICPLQPAGFSAVGQWYDDFSTTTDDDVLRLLAARPR
jgi:putative phosphoribosyl transferase